MAIVRVRLGEYILSEQERKALDEKLNAMSDDEIEYTDDMPKLTKQDWEKAITFAQFNKIVHETA